MARPGHFIPHAAEEAPRFEGAFDFTDASIETALQWASAPTTMQRLELFQGMADVLDTAYTRGMVDLFAIDPEKAVSIVEALGRHTEVAIQAVAAPFLGHVADVDSSKATKLWKELLSQDSEVAEMAGEAILPALFAGSLSAAECVELIERYQWPEDDKRRQAKEQQEQGRFEFKGMAIPDILEMHRHMRTIKDWDKAEYELFDQVFSASIRELITEEPKEGTTLIEALVASEYVHDRRRAASLLTDLAMATGVVSTLDLWDTLLVDPKGKVRKAALNELKYAFRQGTLSLQQVVGRVQIYNEAKQARKKTSVNATLADEAPTSQATSTLTEL